MFAARMPQKQPRRGVDAPPTRSGVLPSVATGPRGRPLDPATRSTMESRFGHDFSRVRVHDGPAAARSAGELGAVAYTIGQHVVLGAVGYAPGTVAGQRLLAHELAHVVQRGRRPVPGAAPRQWSLSSSSAAEREANVAAEAVILGRPARVSERLAPWVVARQPAAPPSRLPAAADALTKEQIFALWEQSKDIADFRFRLLGPVTDEVFYDFLSRKGFNPSETPAQPEPGYAGPSARPTPKRLQTVWRSIYFTDPAGATISRYMSGTPEELDQLQYEARRGAGQQMVWGFATGLAGISAARGQGAPPATTERPLAAERRPAAPAPTTPPRPTTRPAPPTPTAPITAPPAPAARPAATTGPAVTPPPPPPSPATAPAPSHPSQYVRRVLEIPRRWPGLRGGALARDPICPFCQARPSVTADHLEPLVDVDAIVDMGMMTREQAREAANHPSNLRGICLPCNSAKSGRPIGDSSVDPNWWTPPNPDEALIDHMRTMRRWPY